MATNGLPSGDVSEIKAAFADAALEIAGLDVKLEAIGVDAVVDRGRVVQSRVPVGVADCDIGGAAVVLGVDGDDLC